MSKASIQEPDCLGPGHFLCDQYYAQMMRNRQVFRHFH